MARSAERANEVRKAGNAPVGFGNEVTGKLGKSRCQGGVQLAGGFRRELDFVMRETRTWMQAPHSLVVHSHLLLESSD